MIVHEGQKAISAQKPISALIRELLDDAGEIVREEVRLAKAETSEKVSEVGRSLVPIGIGAVVGLAALILMISALDRGLTALLAQALPLEVAVWLAPLVLAIVVGAVAWSFINKGKSALRRLSVVPEKTMQTLQEDKEWIRSRLS
jgi:heme/copper-type cytochrome/quinol oxidase subunit 2